MIARIIIPIIVFTLLSYLWVDKHYHHKYSPLRRILFWLRAAIVIGYSSYLAILPNFVPDNPVLVDVWFVIMACCAVPTFVYAFCSFIGWLIMRLFHKHQNYGRIIGRVLATIAFICFIYGFTKGFRNLEIQRITLEVNDLPKSFEGYRIVQFSDIHLGSFYGWRSDIPQRDIDSINALHPDMICFTGDLQNSQPSEIEPYKDLLASLHAKDGVYSILGNHDYSFYFDGTEAEKMNIEKRVKELEWQLGWHLLLNEHVTLYRGQDSIFIAGTENYKKPAHSEVAKSLYGIHAGSFVLMLQHIPTQWREMWPSTINKIHGSKDSVLVAPQLTLSGHTHAGQVSLLGLRPTLFAPFDYGLYEHEGCQLYTTAGLGGVVPLRIGATAEIVVFTLKRKK